MTFQCTENVADFGGTTIGYRCGGKLLFKLLAMAFMFKADQIPALT